MKSPIPVMLVEDNREYRDVIRLALKRDEGLELVSEFGTAEIALRTLQGEQSRNHPHVVLLDLRLPGMSGLDALSYFSDVLPDAKVIILTQSDQEADVLRAIAMGASGYLLKSSTVAEIKDGIQTVMSGGASLDPRVAKFLLRSLKSRLPKVESDKVLSQREMEILKLLGDGLVKKEIGERLGISYPTVDSHVRHIYEKLDVRNAPSAITMAHRLGIYPSDD